jgi:DUF4097 and DUF4098 domain-containing protein YvlB
VTKLLMISFCAAASCVFASLTGCVVTTTSRGRNNTTVKINGVTVSGGTSANSAEETVQKRFKAESVRSIQSTTDSGSIRVLPVESGPDEIRVQATKTLHGAESADTLKSLLAEVTVQAELVNGALVLSAKNPADFEKRNISVVIDYVVTVPPRLAVDLRTGSGAISVRGVQGGSKLHSDYGSIDLRDVGANLDVSTNSGSVSIEQALNTTGIAAKSSYGNIDLRQVAGSIAAETDSGSVTVNDAERAGSIKLHSGYGNVTVSNASGMLEATSSSGTVKLSNSRLSSRLSLHSDYGNVEATDVSSAETALTVEMTTQSGAITFLGAASDLTLQSDYGVVNGELSSALTLRAAALRSSSGSVSLVLPANSSASVNASTSNGSVELPSGRSGNSGSMTLGAGSAHVKLESDYGDVVLRTK